MLECRMRADASRRHARWTDVATSDGLEPGTDHGARLRQRGGDSRERRPRGLDDLRAPRHGWSLAAAPALGQAPARLAAAPSPAPLWEAHRLRRARRAAG